MSKNDGGPAFPAIHSIDGNWVKEPQPEYLGMSLRAYFAGQAMASAFKMAHEMSINLAEDDEGSPYDTDKVTKLAALISVSLADALIAELEK